MRLFIRVVWIVSKGEKIMHVYNKKIIKIMENNFNDIQNYKQVNKKKPTNSRNVGFQDFFLNKPCKKWCFSNTTISNQNDFKQVIMVLWMSKRISNWWLHLCKHSLFWVLHNNNLIQHPDLLFSLKWSRLKKNWKSFCHIKEGS